jgi:hypothetical protein
MQITKRVIRHVLCCFKDMCDNRDFFIIGVEIISEINGCMFCFLMHLMKPIKEAIVYDF